MRCCCMQRVAKSEIFAVRPPQQRPGIVSTAVLLLMAASDEFDTINPFPDVHALFLHYNHLYFDESLGACSVEWSSSRMTL